ncbi:hypothetical protein RJ640_027681 [Escallonia rubra]|uniref:ABC transporter domain-containing protein n=1 Tax=Escallonia rubra TaxID=112253 RepID=A0AA88S0E6_9ASTE|nr:hypothetical protein RJ640_027681 [Escallonia rubra]
MGTSMEIEGAFASASGGGGGDDVEKGEVESIAGNEGVAYLVWEDLTVVLPNFGHGPTKRLLHGLSGYGEPGRIMAIMGPSGSGKSTLLDALAGRLSTNVVMTGNILLNGNKRRLNYGVVAYVTQDDVLLGTLTVRETITYSAHLRLPTTLTKEEVQEIVEGTIMEMGLEDCADRLIGNWHLRGISGGERKRVSIALEILVRPRLLFLDEPTSGLDSASAFFVVQALKSVARDGRTVISSIHQPSSEVFALFDDLFLLSGGETVYFGEAKVAIKFFAEAGFPCPSRRNPSDHFLRCINSDFDIVTATLKGSQRIRETQKTSDPLSIMATAQIKAMLVEKYKRSEYSAKARSRMRELSTIQGLQVEASSGSQAGWWKQLCTLTRRSFVNMSRDMGYYWLRIIIYIIVSICVGTIYYDVGTGYTAILARGACGGFITGFMTFMSIGGFPSFIEEMRVFYRERLNGYYGVAVFILSNFLSSFPYLVAVAFTTGTITYYMVKFGHGVSHYVYFCLNIFGAISVVESCMMIIASLVPNFLMGIITGAGVLGIMMMTAGFFRLLSDLPKPVWRYPISYISYGSWSLQGARELLVVNMEIEVAEAAVAADIGSAAAGDLEKGVISDGAAYLAWEELTVVLPNFGNGPTRRLLNGLTGYAQPGRIMAIMGPSGSGKSTLLDSLAGRLSGNAVMTGNVLLNGRKKRLDYGVVAYVTQEDILLGTLTVKETITYSAQLRLPGNMTKDQVNEIVEGAIMEMGLQDCADQLIGNWHLRGISGGEKKRLGIALEILTRPSLLFLDEPTSGLDSASAFFVVQALRNVCCGGRTIISSIHQPSSEVFALFNDLFLLSGGETVYFGEAKKALEVQKNLISLLIRGFHVQVKEIPLITLFDVSTQTSTVSMPLLWDLIEYLYVSSCSVTTTIVISLNSVQDIQSSSGPFLNLATAEIKARLVERYKSSEYAKEARFKVREILITEGLHMKTTIGSQATWSKQLCTLTRRSFVNMSRDFGYYWLRIVVYLAVSICVGTVFFDIGTSYNAILARGACGGFISGFMTFMSIGGFPSFIEEMKIFHRERLNGHYGVGVFTLSNFFSSFPFLAVMSLGTATVTYNMVKFRPGFSHFIYAYLDLLSSIAVVESCMMVVASLVPNFLMGIIAGSGVNGIMMMSAGFFRLFPDLPKPFWRYPFSYINYMAWALQGAYKNDMIGIEFDPAQPGDPKLKGEVLLETVLGISLRHSKWWDLAVVISILLFYRLLFFTILKFKERASPVFRKHYAKRTLQHLRKRPSFRKTPPFPSKRHQIVHSLSSQEGLNSPIH